MTHSLEYVSIDYRVRLGNSRWRFYKDGKFEQWAQFMSPQYYANRVYAVIASYLDESFDPKQKGIFAVGGLLVRGRPAFELERKWEQLRQKPEIEIEYFKASECERGSKQFAKFVANPAHVTPQERTKLDAIWNRFLDIILGDPAEHSIIFGIGVVQDDFYEVIKDQNAKSILGESPYWFAYQAAMIEAAFAMKKVRDTVAFVCDKDEEHSDIAPDVYREVMKKNPNAAKYMGTFSTSSDDLCEPLQAADAAIYELRRAFHVSVGRWQNSPHFDRAKRWQFNKLSDARRIWLMQYANKRYLEDVVKENTPGEPLNIDHFMEQEFNKNVSF